VLPPSRRFVLSGEPRDPVGADRLDEDVRGLQDDRGDARRASAGANDRDRSAVAVAEENGLLETEMFEDGGQHVEGLVVHEADWPGAAGRIGCAIA
jgi:hypothetical protein